MFFYVNKIVLGIYPACIVKEVFWNEQEEKFVYYIEDDQEKLMKVFEKQITLIEAQQKTAF